MLIGSLSIGENRILEVFQKVECGQGSFGLPFLFFFFLFLNLFNWSALFLLLRASKVLSLFLINGAVILQAAGVEHGEILPSEPSLCAVVLQGTKLI